MLMSSVFPLRKDATVLLVQSSYSRPRLVHVHEDAIVRLVVTRHGLPTDSSQSQGTCQDTERSLNSMINNLPDEVILEIFASYRQGIDPYDYQWSKKCVWFQSHAYLPKVARCHLCVVLPFKFGHFRGTGKTG